MHACNQSQLHAFSPACVPRRRGFGAAACSCGGNLPTTCCHCQETRTAVVVSRDVIPADEHLHAQRSRQVATRRNGRMLLPAGSRCWAPILSPTVSAPIPKLLPNQHGAGLKPHATATQKVCPGGHSGFLQSDSRLAAQKLTVPDANAAGRGKRWRQSITASNIADQATTAL